MFLPTNILSLISILLIPIEEPFTMFQSLLKFSSIVFAITKDNLSLPMQFVISKCPPIYDLFWGFVQLSLSVVLVVEQFPCICVAVGIFNCAFDQIFIEESFMKGV